jgi:predicted aspartyl protease
MKSGGSAKMGRFKVQIEIANNDDLVLAKTGHLAPDKVRRTIIDGVVDSGAVRLVLPQKVAEDLGLSKVGTIGVRYADQRRAKRTKVGNVWLKYLGREEVFSAIVEPKRKDALIGAIVLEGLDLPRDPKGIIAEIE